MANKKPIAKTVAVTEVRHGMTFPALGTFWKVTAWNDTDETWLCRNYFDKTCTNYFPDEKIREIMGIRG